MWLKWLPWRFVVRKLAHKQGFLDPVEIWSKLERFSQPAEVAAPVELMRLGLVLQARGLMNAQAIQHNLDWVWPFWVKRQFNPRDPAFIPRAFSMTHINLTHRNWTALGIPGYANYPLVDPRGLITPFYDSWSLDVWVLSEEGGNLIPSESDSVKQSVLFEPAFSLRNTASAEGLGVSFEAWVENPKHPNLQIRIQATAGRKAWLAVSLRPFNPEGVSFVHDIKILEKPCGWRVDGKKNVYFSQPWDRHCFSQYKDGDVFRKLPVADHLKEIQCPVGMATAAALFELQPKQMREVSVQVPLEEGGPEILPSALAETTEVWGKSLLSSAPLQIPDTHFNFLYKNALHTLILHSPKEIYPGPFTYKHFWFRDGALIAYAMLCAGLTHRVENIMDLFFARQNMTGYFHSQDGEWDSNGQVLWFLEKFCRLTGRPPKPEWKSAILKGAHWIQKKRLGKDAEELRAGLFPAGFSAEHLGPNDFYYWDDFWGAQGLRSAAWLLQELGEKEASREFQEGAQDFLHCIEKSLFKVAAKRGHDAMPASPYRRLDAGAIGSIVAGYPLRLWPENDSRILETVHYLMRSCFVDNAFFHDIAHSGINPYLTLQIAQVLMRAGDPRFFEIVKTMAKLASPTGQWPEAIHPQTLGGCMGDGEHVWASAEWVLMMRNMLVREEGDKLILGSGLTSAWLKKGMRLVWGPAPTEFGPLQLQISCNEEIRFQVTARWSHSRPKIEIRLPGREPVIAEKDEISLPAAKQEVS